MTVVPNHERNPQDGKYSSRYLSRKRVVYWDEPAYTVLTSARDSSLHPGPSNERSDVMTYNVTPHLAPNGFTVAELFAGGGLMAVGLRAAGYDIIWANDFDKSACAAYRHNLGDHIVHGDITALDIDSIPDADVIAGGPPCQDYSVAGTGAGEEGERGKLVWRYLEIIERKRPKAFVFENVKGLITKRHRPTFDALLTKFEEIGYRVSWQLINAWDYGVAQKRERVFIVGIRADLGFAFEFPEPRPEDYRTQVLRDVIGDLPEPGDYFYTHRTRGRKAAYGADEPAPTLKTFQRNMPPNYEPHPEDAHVQNHERKEISEKALAGYERRGGQGGFGFRVNEWDAPSPTIFGRIFNEGKAFVHPGPIENHNEKSYWTPKNGDSEKWDQANRVQQMGAPSATIPAHHNNGQPIHPTQAPRRFTVRECLRIQSVPDSYVLPEGVSLSAQYRIVGNGVASRVAYLLGIALAEQLRAATESDVREAATTEADRMEVPA